MTHLERLRQMAAKEQEHVESRNTLMAYDDRLDGNSLRTGSISPTHILSLSFLTERLPEIGSNQPVADALIAGAEAIDEVSVLRERVGELEAQAAGRRCTQCAMAASFMAGGGDGGVA